MKLKLTVEEYYVLAAALAAYISLGTAEPESENPTEAVSIMHAMIDRSRTPDLDDMTLLVSEDSRPVIIAALYYAVAFYTIYKEDSRAAVLSLVLKIDDQWLTEEVHDYYAGEW